ncbi:hypothetical protein ORV05_13225 [Amycolatopsis cynarae]|uniref:NADP-dependent oxidoreductase n=1 Tax=Amycolatopsis cynarae TaxID=2995223 RepID=A0ABY7B963_9PSEU|nr:hypothetical protein [Amycolatopsis sp. HUAS 11-8]WAL68691.1 hypothetical protein ORV05_13225 [Amycolatopsis sp. HUAS 11-8]
MSDTTMRAVLQHSIGGPDVLSVEQVPRPEPLPTEVRVKVHAAGINPVDWKTRAGAGMAGVLGEPPFIPQAHTRGESNHTHGKLVLHVAS